MKTCSLYGFLLAVASAIVTLALYFLGYHSDPAKVGTGQLIGGLVILTASLIITALGIKARRAEVPESEPFGYGRALGAGVLVGVLAGVLAGLVPAAGPVMPSGLPPPSWSRRRR